MYFLVFVHVLKPLGGIFWMKYNYQVIIALSSVHLSTLINAKFT